MQSVWLRLSRGASFSPIVQDASDPPSETAMNPTPIREVLQQEVEQIETARRLRLEKDEPGLPAEKTLIGLAFSGGGIRSATFNLGVLQALARKKLLRKFDYISTVSGGATSAAG